MSKEHDEAVQAYKEGKIDTGIHLANGKWILCGVFKGKMSWMDLPLPEEHQVGPEGVCDVWIAGEDCSICDGVMRRRIIKNEECDDCEFDDEEDKY